MLVIAAGAVGPGDDAWRHLASTVLAEYILNSTILIMGAGGLALVIGVAAAWLVTACDFPGRRWFEWALVLPLAVPSYIAAYTYVGMLDTTGPLPRLLRPLAPAVAEWLVRVPVMGMTSVLVIFALVLYPYVYLITRASFERQSRTALEAARALGHGPAATFRRIALPLARPAIVGGVALVVMEVLNDYGAVKYYGVPTFTTGIFRAWFGLGDLDAAIRLAACLMIVVFAVLALERAQRRGQRYVGGEIGERPLPRFPLRGGAAAGAILACAIPVFLGFLLPVAQLVYWAARTAPRVVDGSFARLALNSLSLAFGAALLCVLTALVVAYAVRLGSTRGMRLLTRVAVLGYAVPGAVIAVGVLVPAAAVDHWLDGALRASIGVSSGLLISGTLAALVFAYLVRFMAVAFSPLESGFQRVCGNLDEAARTLGSAPLRVLLRVALPLLRPALLGALMLVFVDVMKELPLTLILRPFNFDTLATKAYQLATDEQIAESANAALLVILAGVLPVIGLNRLLGRR
ncbi:MAG: ABC transporter permease [Longimicrobiales bacterium]